MYTFEQYAYDNLYILHLRKSQHEAKQMKRHQLL